MLLIILILIFTLVLSNLLAKVKLGRLLIGLITYFLIILVCGKVTYTPDWEGYEYLIISPNRLELFFKYISEYALNKGYIYKDVHFFYISLYTIFLLWFISAFNNNVFIVSFLYLIFVFLFYTTQIRFFMAYYAGILALYYFLYYKRYNLSLSLFIFAFLNHYSIIILLLYIPFYSIDVRKLKKVVYIISVSCIIFFLILDSFFPLTALLNSEVRYLGYLKSDLRSSALGGLAFFFPYIIYLPFLTSYYFKLRKMIHNKEIIKKIDFLFKMTIIPYIFIGISIYIQIIGHRFVIPSLFISLLLYFQLSKIDKSKKSIAFFILFISFGIIYNYFLLPSILNSDSFEVISMMLESNQIIQMLKF